ncbi:LamG-like jellyroll fold domain-containing protein, partial [Clostridium sp. HMP27]|uniref:LamG-like jellyroll fold domain-containing protein n=1 Tax=Clostridium sp. HMP27 TaxID=1487921 RepID=UPI00342E420D
MGDKGVNPYDENAVFEKNDDGDTALAAYEGTTNLLKNNSSFENSTSSWVVGDMGSNGTGKFRIVNDGFYGTKALELYDSDGLYDGSKTNTAAYQYVELPAALSAPKTYTLSAYAKKTSYVNPEIYVNFIDASGEDHYFGKGDPTVIPDGKWTRISKSFTAPVGTKRIAVFVRAQVQDEFVVRFDGVQLEEKNFPSAYTEGTLQPSKVLYDLGMNKASGTMSVWFNTSQNGTTRHIIGNQKDTAQLFNVYLDSGNKLNLSILDNGAFRNVITLTDTPIEKDKWNFVSVTWRMEGDTLKCKLYLNDKAPKEGTVVNPVDFTGAVTALGSSIKGTQQLNGRLQQFSFSKELLNDE